MCLMSLVDPSNNNSPDTPTNTLTAEYPWSALAVSLQAFHQGAGNNNMTPNSGSVYLLVKGAQGPGNKSDPGAMIKVLLPTADFSYPSGPYHGLRFSPYSLYIDADVAGDGVLAVLYGGQGA